MDIPVTPRRLALPVALLAAIAIAAAGGSSPWSVRPPARADVAHQAEAPVVLRLEHIELIATRAQSNGGVLTARSDPRTAMPLPVAGLAIGMTTASVIARLPASPSNPSSTVQSKASRYAGIDHVWIPALGISRAVHTFPCSRSRKPDNLVYRWGCAGKNNVYLMGHAWGVMKPLHDAYLAGHLHAGMLAYYADGKGQVHAYMVTTWRIVDPSDSAWAIANQQSPSMTLQTCVGKLRLNVRLVEVFG